MSLRKGILLVGVMTCSQAVLSQCPPGDTAMRRMIFLRESQVPFAEQKKELLGYIVQYQRCQARNDSALVHLLQRTGALSYLLGQYQDAVLYTADAVQRLKDLSPTYSNAPLMVKMYHYLNIFYDSLHYTSNKISAIDSSIYYAINNGLVNNEILNNIMQRVEYSFDMGDYIRCINDAKIAGELNARYGSGQDSVYYAGFFFNSRISSMIEMNDVSSAEVMLNQKVNDLVKNGKKKLCGPLYNQLSRISVRNQQYDDALRYLQLSYECNRLLSFALGCKQTLNNIGYTYYRYLNNPQRANEYYVKALRFNSSAIQDKNVNLVENVNVLGNIANVFVKLNRYDSAFYYFDKAFSLVGTGYDEQRLLKIPDDEFNNLPNIHYITSMVRDKADAYFNRYQSTHDLQWLDKSINTYRSAHLLLMRIKKGQKELLSKLLWRKTARVIYEHAIEASYAARRWDDAFYFFERSRAVLLIDKMAINRSTSPETLRKIAGLDMKIQELNIQADSMSNDTLGLYSIRKKIYDLTIEKDLAGGMVKNKMDDEKELQLAEVKGRLPHHSNLVEIFVGDSAVYILTVGSGVDSLVKADREQYEQRSVEYIQFLADAGKMNREYDRFLQVSHSLYQLIFGNHNAEKLIVSPDGKYFPFESLVVKMNGRQPEYLVSAAAVSYAYSAQYLAEETSQIHHESSAFFGMAPVTYNASLHLTPLSESDASLKKIGSLFGDRILFTGNDAMRHTFLDKYFRYEVVQLYTHATETDQHGEPVIYFADSALRLAELPAVGHPATKIVILSACETGNGKWFEGEGVFSFNRSFAEIGVPSAMVNLWSVDNESTYRLNELFCERLSRGVASDVALQQAKIAFMKTADKEHQLPFYWAAPIISGRVITLQRHLTPWWSYGVAGVVLLIALFFFGRKFFLKKTKKIN